MWSGDLAVRGADDNRSCRLALAAESFDAPMGPDIPRRSNAGFCAAPENAAATWSRAKHGAERQKTANVQLLKVLLRMNVVAQTGSAKVMLLPVDDRNRSPRATSRTCLRLRAGGSRFRREGRCAQARALALAVENIA